MKKESEKMHNPRGNTIVDANLIFLPILTGDHDISLLVQHHNHGNHGSNLYLWNTRAIAMKTE